MIQVEQELLHSSLAGSGQCFDLPPQAVESGEGRKRQRRKKAKGEDGDAELKKRRLSDDQVRFLEMNFGEERKLESRRKVQLAAELGLDPKQVAVWFQNRRARWKNKQLEGEYLNIKAAYDGIVIQKCHLENEVLSLKEKLSQAEEQLKKLSVGHSGGASDGEGSRGGGSPCSSFSTATQQTFLGEMGVEEDDLMYISEYYYNNYMMDWGNIYGV